MYICKKNDGIITDAGECKYGIIKRYEYCNMYYYEMK